MPVTTNSAPSYVHAGPIASSPSTDWDFCAHDGTWTTVEVQVVITDGDVPQPADYPEELTRAKRGVPDKEVLDMARYLGLQQDGGVACRWLAEDASIGPLPPGWTEYLQPTNGVVYFCHEASGGVTWQNPRETHFLEMAAWVTMLTARLERLLSAPARGG